MSSRSALPSSDTIISIRSSSATRERLLCAGLVIACLLPLAGQARPPIGRPSLGTTTALGKTTIFLADPQLGVAGAYQDEGRTLYFEARTPDGPAQMSARLLDAAGRTIAISGHSMDGQWLAETSFDPASAAESLSLAGAVSAELANVLDRAVFAREIRALSNLAVGAAQVPPAKGAVMIDSATANLPPVNASAAAASSSYDSTAARDLIPVRDAQGNLSVTFNGTQIETFVEKFPDGENGDNPAGELGRTEVSAQILSSSGKSLIQQIGGDDVPDGWDSETTGMFRPGSQDPLDPIQTGIEAGQAIRAAALMVRFPFIATPEETEAIGNLAEALRNESMFPGPATDLDSNSSASCGNCYRSDIQVWNKSLVVVAQHSGTVVLHYNNNNPQRYPVLEYQSIYCNHGTCPDHKPMNHACTYRGPWMGTYRYAPHWKITAPPPSPPSGYHSCHKTPYHLYSGYYWPVIHGHNCNDDSWTQIRAIKGESYDINPSDNPFSNGARCDNHGFVDPRSPGCNS
jgi:hypothetical protein